MIPYLFILFITIVIFVSHSFNNEKQNRITALLWVVIMSVFVGLQDGVGEDSLTYRSWVNMDPENFHDISATIIVYFVTYFHLPDVSVFFIYTIIAYTFLTLFLLSFPKDYRAVGVLLLFSNIYFIQSFNIIRQIAAASVFIYGALLFYQGKKKSYILFIVSPILHLTALLGIALLFVSKLLKLNLPLFMVYIISIVIFLMGGVIQYLNSLSAILSIYDDHYEYLAEIEVNVYAGLGLQYLLTLFYGIMIFKQRKSPLLIKYKDTILLSFIGLILYNLLASEITFFRMSYYFFFFIYAAVPLIIGSFNKKDRSIVAVSLSCLYVFQFVLIISANKSFFPYKSVLF